MQSLSFLQYLGEDTLVPKTLRGFPDVNARSPNDPVYMLSSQDTLKIITQFAAIDDRTEITLNHYAVLWDYAIRDGWQDIYIDGGQLFFISGLGPKAPVVPTTILRHVMVDVDREKQTEYANLLGLAAKYDPVLSEMGASGKIHEVFYVKDGRRIQLVYGEGSYMDAWNVALHLDDGTYLICNTITGEIRYRDVPEGNLRFEIKYGIQFN